jgi:hypothetical protein
MLSFVAESERFDKVSEFHGGSVATAGRRASRRPCDLAGGAVTVRLLRAKISVMGSRPGLSTRQNFKLTTCDGRL